MENYTIIPPVEIEEGHFYIHRNFGDISRIEVFREVTENMRREMSWIITYYDDIKRYYDIKKLFLAKVNGLSIHTIITTPSVVIMIDPFGIRKICYITDIVEDFSAQDAAFSMLRNAAAEEFEG